MNNIEKAFSAIRWNKIDDMHCLLQSINIESVNDLGQNLLHVASAYNNITWARELLGLSININHQEYTGAVPLHYCAENNAFDVADEILKYSPDLSIEDKYGNQPLWTAVFNARGKYDMVKAFISHGADPHHKNKNNKSPLDFANQIKNPQLIALLKG